MTILIPVPCFASVQEPDRRAEKLGGKVAHAASEWWAGAVAPRKVHCKLSILDKDCIGQSQMPTGLALLNFSAVLNKDYKHQFQSYNMNSNVILDYLDTSPLSCISRHDLFITCPEFHLKRYAQMEVRHLIQVCCLEAQHFWYPSNFPEKNKNCKLPVDSNSLNLIEDNKLLYNLCLDVWRINWVKQFF
jgi:hypothetical protein